MGAPNSFGVGSPTHELVGLFLTGDGALKQAHCAACNDAQPCQGDRFHSFPNLEPATACKWCGNTVADLMGEVLA